MMVMFQLKVWTPLLGQGGVLYVNGVGRPNPISGARVGVWQFYLDASGAGEPVQIAAAVGREPAILCVCT